MFPILHNHSDALFSVAGYWIFSAAVSTMPAPGTTSGVPYTWLYHFAHAIAANLDRYVKPNVAVPAETPKDPGSGHEA